MGRFVIVVYKPKAGMAAALESVVAKHMDVLGTEGLITDRPALAMRAADGSIVEVFEWRSADAIQQAHTNPRVQALWGEFDAICSYTPLSELAEARQMFAEFDALT